MDPPAPPRSCAGGSRCSAALPCKWTCTGPLSAPSLSAGTSPSGWSWGHRCHSPPLGTSSKGKSRKITTVRVELTWILPRHCWGGFLSREGNPKGKGTFLSDDVNEDVNDNESSCSPNPSTGRMEKEREFNYFVLSEWTPKPQPKEESVIRRQEGSKL